MGGGATATETETTTRDMIPRDEVIAPKPAGAHGTKASAGGRTASAPKHAREHAAAAGFLAVFVAAAAFLPRA